MQGHEKVRPSNQYTRVVGKEWLAVDLCLGETVTAATAVSVVLGGWFVCGYSRLWRAVSAWVGERSSTTNLSLMCISMCVNADVQFAVGL